MNNLSEALDLELICAIVNYGMGSKLLKSAKRHGISGGTITLASGTVHSHLLDFIGLSDMRKEILYMAADRKTARDALDKLNREFEFHKPNHGIVFTSSICGLTGTHSIVCSCGDNKVERGADPTMYHIITIIVDKGKAEDAVAAAEKVGAKGGTIINARGSGIHETCKLFSMEFEPEKEIVIILSEAHQTEDIVNAVREQLKMDEPGNGILFVQNANSTYGIYK